MFTILYEPIPHPAPDAQGVPCLMVEQGNAILGMSLCGFEAMPDDDVCWLDWSTDNTNEAPWAWKDRRPTF